MTSTKATATITDLQNNTTTVPLEPAPEFTVFWPKIQSTGPVRVFAVLKGGLLNSA